MNIRGSRKQRSLLTGGLFFAVIFFLLAPRSPLTGWLLTRGVAESTIDLVANIAGLTGLVLLVAWAVIGAVYKVPPESRSVRTVVVELSWLIGAFVGAFSVQWALRFAERLGLSGVSRFLFAGGVVFLVLLVSYGIIRLFAGSRARRVRLFVVVDVRGSSDKKE